MTRHGPSARNPVTMTVPATVMLALEIGRPGKSRDPAPAPGANVRLRRSERAWSTRTACLRDRAQPSAKIRANPKSP